MIPCFLHQTLVGLICHQHACLPARSGCHCFQAWNAEPSSEMTWLSCFHQKMPPQVIIIAPLKWPEIGISNERVVGLPPDPASPAPAPGSIGTKRTIDRCQGWIDLLVQGEEVLTSVSSSHVHSVPIPTYSARTPCSQSNQGHRILL